MTLTNVSVTKGGWVQVYAGTNAATVVASGFSGEICQSAAQPSNTLIGLPFDGASLIRYIYNSTAGDPVWVKPYDDGIVIVNA